MTNRSLLLVVVLLTPAVVYSAAPPRFDPDALAARIDRHLATRFTAARIQPAPIADDAEFLRRVYLDLTGRVPRAADVHEFLADRSPNRRAQLIDRLLEEPRHSVHQANVWRADLLPEIAADRQAALFQVGFQNWFIERFRAGTPYDRMVRELIAVPIPVGSDGAPVLRDPERSNALAFIAAKDGKPENLAAAVGRSFLGLRLECAQCHDHPFASWTQRQFWSQSAFFAGLRQRGGRFAPVTESPDRRELAMPGKNRMVRAAFLDGRKTTFSNGQSSRIALAEWVTAPDNPYFARATVNKVWAQLFGIGLVDPVDDFRDDNPPSAPELLDDLTRAFVDSGYDLSYLLRAICRSQAYQRTSARTHSSQDGTNLPARMGVKAMTAEQFIDSLALVTGYRDDSDGGASRRQFLTRFALTGPAGEPETSVQQALTLLNGRFVAWATDPERCPTLLAITQTPGLSTTERIDALVITTLGRKPTPRERSRFEKHVRGVDSARESERLADVFWVLLNCSEFRLNH
jgi:Protein of unknown function (DUF1549)/Protein of unknown function (DUF1553)